MYTFPFNILLLMLKGITILSIFISCCGMWYAYGIWVLWPSWLWLCWHKSKKGEKAQRRNSDVALQGHYAVPRAGELPWLLPRTMGGRWRQPVHWLDLEYGNYNLGGKSISSAARGNVVAWAANRRVGAVEETSYYFRAYDALKHQGREWFWP